MAVELISSIKRFVGLSTDTKPTGVPVGSFFYAYDSQLTWITYDGTNWVISNNLPNWTMEHTLEDM